MCNYVSTFRKQSKWNWETISTECRLVSIERQEIRRGKACVKRRQSRKGGQQARWTQRNTEVLFDYFQPNSIHLVLIDGQSNKRVSSCGKLKREDGVEVDGEDRENIVTNERLNRRTCRISDRDMYTCISCGQQEVTNDFEQRDRGGRSVFKEGAFYAAFACFLFAFCLFMIYFYRNGSTSSIWAREAVEQQGWTTAKNREKSYTSLDSHCTSIETDIETDPEKWPKANKFLYENKTTRIATSMKSNGRRTWETVVI